MMNCIACGGSNVQWKGPLGRLTHTECGDCGEIDGHQHPSGTEEGDRCGRDLCQGIIEIKPVENCTCHLGHPPCGACVSLPLWCPACHWESEE